MSFINPKTDFAFKKIFGSEQHPDILISFVNSLLYGDDSVIQDLDILNPYQAPRIRGVKETYLDVKACLTDGTTVIIEMQVLNIAGFEKRILYNAAKAYSTQLAVGQPYTHLNPIIALTITEFVMFPEHDPYQSRFLLKEKEFLFDYPRNDLELVFIELPKFQRTLDELNTIQEKWLYFLQNALQLETVPDTLQQVSAIQTAFGIANQANLTVEEFDELERQEFFIQDQRGAIAKAAQEAAQKAAQASQEAVQKATQEAAQKATQKATQETQAAIALRLLSILDDPTISQTTGLSLDEIQQLRQAGPNL